MAIRVLFATAHRQTLTIQYENPFGDCFTEYDLDEYTAQDAAKTGREPFLTIRAAQWSAVCRDLLNARKVDSKQVHKALVRFASPAARQIFFEECEKVISRRKVKDGYTKEEAQTEARAVVSQIAEQMQRQYSRETLDDFAAHFTVRRFTLDDFAEAVAV